MMHHVGDKACNDDHEFLTMKLLRQIVAWTSVTCTIYYVRLGTHYLVNRVEDQKLNQEFLLFNTAFGRCLKPINTHDMNIITNI